jgi:hypothetical protein
LNEPPEGITLEKILPGRDGMELVFRGDATKAASGLEGNLIVNVYPAAGSNAARGRPQANRQRQPVGTLPAIPFRVSAP